MNSANKTTIDSSFFPDNLTSMVKDFGGIGSFSTATGVSRQMLNRYMNGDAEPGLSVLLKLVTTLGTSVENLCGSEPGTSFYEGEFRHLPYLEISSIPLFHQKTHQRYATTAFSRFLLSTSYYAKKFMVSFDDLRLFCVDNDSMSPTLNYRDLVVISIAPEHQVPSDGIFLLRQGDSITIRRIQHVDKDKCMALPDNHLFSNFIFEPGPSITIIGRILTTIGLS